MKDFFAVFLFLVVFVAFFVAVGSITRSNCENSGGNFVQIGGHFGCIYPQK